VSSGAAPGTPTGVLWFLRTLLGYARPHRWPLTLVILGLTVEMAVNALVPLSFKVLIDQALPGRRERVLLLTVGALAIGVVAMAGAGLLRDVVYARLASGLLADVRARMFAHLQQLSLDYYARTEAGDVLARFSTDLAAIEYALASATWGILPSFDVLLTTILLFALDWRLALVAMLVWPCALLGPRVLAPRATEASYVKKRREADTLTTVQEHVAAQAVVKSYGLERIAMEAFGRRNAALTEVSARVNLLTALIERSAGLGVLLLQVVTMAVGALLVFRGHMSIGTLVAFQALFITLSYALYNVAQYAPALVQASGGLRGIDELLQETPLVRDAPGARTLARQPGAIELRGVSVDYPGQTAVLSDVTVPCAGTILMI
jgi:ATP-binding cassette, subfamily B, bacterial